MIAPGSLSVWGYFAFAFSGKGQEQFVEIKDSWNVVYLPLWRAVSELFQGPSDTEFPLKVEAILKNYTLAYENSRFVFKKRAFWSRPNPSESVRVFTYLYLLAKCCETQEAAAKDHDRVRSIYVLFMRPLFKQIQDEGSLEAVEACRKIKCQCLERMFRLANPVQVKEPAVIIQRAFRRHRKGPTFTAKLGPFSYRLTFPPPLPNPCKGIQKEKAEAWINSHSEKWKGTARKVIHSICFRDFTKFLRGLRVAVESFNKELMSKPPGERDYVILIPKDCETKSQAWVTALALIYLRPPLDVQLCEEYNPRLCKNVALLDDGAFSGKQMNRTLDSLPTDVKIHLIIPFMTNSAYHYMTGNRDIWVSEHERMLSIEELKVFNGEELQRLADLTDSYDHGRLFNRSFVYFAHKIPDGLSTISDIFSGFNNLEKKLAPRFIENIKSPYKKND